jgi:hypothetical protein
MPVRAATNVRHATPPQPAQGSQISPVRRRARLAVLSLLLLVAALYAISHMDQGNDTWISLAGGRDVVAHGVRDTEPFSFNSRHSAQPATGAGRWWAWLHPNGWINQNWLTHVLLFTVERAGGLDALVYWKLANCLLVGVTLIAAARVRGAPAVAGLIAAAAALATSRDYLSIRAQDLSNLLAALMFLILALVRVRGARWLWGLVPLFAVWANAHGGFIYGLAVLAVAVATESIAVLRRGKPTADSLRGTATLAAAAAAALAATVALSPYRLANLTHPLVITVSADAPLWRVVREWRSLFSDPLASPVPFIVFAAATGLAWLLAPRRRQATGSPPLLGGDAVIVPVAFALAVASARFVPLACVTAAPFLAVWLHSAWTEFVRSSVPRRQRAVEMAADGVLALAVVAAAAVFGVRAAATYIAPWPQDAVRYGLFDRMTHAHQRPWGACAFLAANGVRGRMWNYWDEGGFLASCQQPDPATGAPPVAIFIDGRAQAAYDVGALASYLDLLNGPGRSAALGEKADQVADLEALRAWTAPRLRELGVGIALVPATRQRTAFARAVAGLPGWQLAYADAEHTLFVDDHDTQGRDLLTRLEAGTARFPDAASAKLTAALRLLAVPSRERALQAVQLASDSYRAQPTSIAVLCVARAGRSPAAREAAGRFCREVAEEFVANQGRHREHPGYAKRLDAALVALEYLAAEAKRTGHREMVRWTSLWLPGCEAEQQRVARQVLW